MTDAITLLGPFQQVLTLSGLPHAGPIRDDALSILEDAGVLVRGGEILGVDRYSELQGSASVLWKPPRPTVLIPGLVDSHTHIAWAGTRARDYSLRIQGVSYQEIAAQGGGIMDTVRQTRTASEDELPEVDDYFEHMLDAEP